MPLEITAETIRQIRYYGSGRKSSRLTFEQVEQLLRAYVEQRSSREAAELTGISRTTTGQFFRQMKELPELLSRRAEGERIESARLAESAEANDRAAEEVFELAKLRVPQKNDRYAGKAAGGL